MKKKIILLLPSILLLSAISVFADFQDNDDCDPAWAPFWQTSCTYSTEDSIGNMIMYKKTCKHFIFTTKCNTVPMYDL